MNSEIPLDPILIGTSLEFHLLRTLTKAKVPRNLRVRVCRIPSGRWELPARSIYPRTCEIPYELSILDERPASSPEKTSLLMKDFEGLPNQTYLKMSQRLYTPELGLDWTACKDAEPLFGESQASGQSQPKDSARNHRLTVSHLGVTQQVPQSQNLHLVLEKMAGGLLNVCTEAVDGQFRLRYDEVSHLIELAFYTRVQGTHIVEEARAVYFYSNVKERRGRKPEEYHQFQEKEEPSLPDWVECSVPVRDAFQDLDNSWLSVFQFVSEVLNGKHIESECGVLQLLNRIIYSVLTWAEVYAEYPIVPLDLDLEELVRPCKTLVQWLEPVGSLFLLPLIGCFHPSQVNYHDTSPSSSQPLPSRDWYASKDTWRICTRLFHNLIKIKDVLVEVRSTRNLKLLTKFCLELFSLSGEYPAFPSKQVMGFLRKAVQDAEVLEKLSKCFEQPLCEFQTQYSAEVQSKHTIRRVELSMKQLDLIFKCTIRPIVRIGSNDSKTGLVRITEQNWVTVRKLGGGILPVKTHTKAPAPIWLRIDGAIKYKDIVVLFPMRKSEDGFETHVVDEQGLCSRHRIKTKELFTDEHEFSEDESFFAQPEIPDEYAYSGGRSTLFRVWSQGLLVWFADREDQIVSLNALSFRTCVAGSKETPKLHTLHLKGNSIGLKWMKFDMHNDLWTVGFDTVCLLVTVPSALPALLACRITQAGISPPDRIEWVSQFTEEQIKGISGFEMNRNHIYNFNIIAAQDSRTLFMSFLQPRKCRPLLDKRDSDRDLWILCFKRKTPLGKLCFLTKNLYKVHIDENRAQWGSIFPQTHPLVTKIIHIRKTDFLLLSAEKQPLRVFTVQRNRLTQIALNGKTSSDLPALPGRKIWGAGLLTNHFAAYSVVEQRDQWSGKTQLQFYALKFAF